MRVCFVFGAPYSSSLPLLLRDQAQSDGFMRMHAQKKDPPRERGGSGFAGIRLV